MASINPYLNFPGNTEEVFNFYKSVFGGEFLAVQRFADTPDAANMPADVKNMIMHISLPIGKGNVLMATDAPASMGFNLIQGSNMYICISPDDKEEANRLFNGLSAGGKVTMALQQMFWGALYGDFTDKYGVKWMVNYDMNKRG
ncbi:MAG: VOC family protein [Ferruginibacter sp.]